MQELTNDEYNAIKEFSDGLTQVFSHKLSSENDPIFKICIEYVLKVIDIHLSLAELKFQRYVQNQDTYFNKPEK